MKKILLVANARYTVMNFRRELVLQMQELGHHIEIVCPTGLDLDGQIVSSNQVKPIYLDRKGIHPFRDWRTLKDLFLIFLREKPDVVLSFTIKPVIYGSLMAALASSAKIYSNITGLGYVFTDTSWKARGLKKIVMILYRLALSKNNKVFFQNPDDLNLFIQAGLIHKNKSVLLRGSGIDFRQFQVTPVSLKKPKSFIFVGRLLKDKGIFELIAALKTVKKVYPDICCWIVGEADQNPNSLPQQTIEELKNQNLAIFTGRQDDVRPYLAQAQVMILPSYREGTPRSVLEAMSCGLPIITTDVPGCRETVIDGVNGFLVPARESGELAQKMCFFIENPDCIESMGRESLKRVQELFDVYKVNASIIKTMEL